METFALFRIFTIFALVAFSAVIAIELEVTSDKDIVPGGGSVTVKCTIVDFEVGTFVYWRKQQGDDPAVMLGINSQIEDRFKSTGRYQLLDAVTMGDNVEYKLLITDATPEDSGNYGCEAPGRDLDLVTTFVAVPTPVEHVKLFVEPDTDEAEPFVEYPYGAKINFTEGERYHFRCEATGSFPAALYNVMLDEEDVSDKFIEVPDAVQMVIDRSAPEGLRRVTYSNAIHTKEAIEVRSDANTLQLWCHAQAEGTDPVSTYVEASLFFEPEKQDDCQEVVRAGHYQSGIVLSCTIRSDPPPHDFSVSWKEMGTTYTIQAGETHNHYRLVIQEGATRDARQMRLEIDHAFPQLFRSYTFRAESSHGEIDHEVLLQRDQALESISKGSTSLPVSILLMSAIMAAIVALLQL